MEPPPRAKPKGRTKTLAERNAVTLGAQGEKKGNRRCSVCKLLATHNSVTCPTLQKNKDRLEAMKNKRRGRPVGAKNKKNNYGDGNDRKELDERPMQRRRLLEDNCYIGSQSSSENEDDDYVDADLQHEPANKGGRGK
jgi:hypothetical protein